MIYVSIVGSTEAYERVFTTKSEVFITRNRGDVDMSPICHGSRQGILVHNKQQVVNANPLKMELQVESTP